MHAIYAGLRNGVQTPSLQSGNKPLQFFGAPTLLRFTMEMHPFFLPPFHPGFMIDGENMGKPWIVNSGDY
jgi:hypothetical protein